MASVKLKESEDSVTFGANSNDLEKVEIPGGEKSRFCVLD